MKRTDFFESLRLRLPAMPRLMPAGGGAPLQFASSGGGAGGGGGYDDPDEDYYDEYDGEPAPRRRDDTDRQPTAARQRTVQSEPDDRYWTDYLRIALPVIGLLLVIAVFWFWAQQLIDDPEDDLTPTEAPGIAEVIENPTQPAGDVQDETIATPPTDPPPTQAPVVTPTPEQVEAEVPNTGTDDQQETTDGTDSQVQADPDEGAEEPAQQDAEPEGLAPDMSVVVSEDGEGLRMRADASTTSEIVTELSAGDALTIVSGPQSGEDYVWWEVTDQAGNIGWVAEDFIVPAE